MTAALKLMTADEFLLWRLDREGTWELVDGVPVLKFDNGPNMMAGASRSHGRITTNVIMALGQRLRNGPCYPLGGQFAVRTHAQGVRQQDVLVECGRGDGDDLEATEARVIVEVLSPSTRGIDLVRKADEYRRLSTTAHLILIEPDRVKAIVWTRVGTDWVSEIHQDIAAGIFLAAIDVELPMSEIYEGLSPSG